MLYNLRYFDDNYINIDIINIHIVYGKTVL